MASTKLINKINPKKVERPLFDELFLMNLCV